MKSDPMATKEQFDAACQQVRTDTSMAQPTRETALRLYGLYKRVVCGRNYTPIPMFFEVEKKMKHSAWTATNTVSVQEAMDEYVNTVNSLKHINMK